MSKSERDRYMLKDEYKRFIENTPEQYKLFWKIVFHSGLRISEGLNLTTNDILWEENKLLIATLKRKDHPIFPIIIPKDLIDELRIYISGSMWKNPAINGRIWKYSRQFAWKIFKSICKKAGLNSKYSPHAFRHSHGIIIADVTNGNMIEIKNRLRHSSIKSTEFYVHCSEAKQKELSDKIQEYMK